MSESKNSSKELILNIPEQEEFEVSFEDTFGSTCTTCGKHIDAEGYVEECYEPDCDQDTVSTFALEDEQELNFH